MSDRGKRFLLCAGTPVLLAAITFADYATGPEFGFFVFYIAPVALAAWYGSRALGVAYAMAAGACWFLVDRLSHTPYSNALFIYWETFMRLVSFLVTALTLSQIRSDLRKREELLDVISHDLRSPLGALTFQAQVLAKRCAADGFVAPRAEAILRCASRMNGMIEDLVDSARQDSHQLRPSLEPVRVGPYLAELLDRCASLLDPGRVRPVLEPVGALVLRADPARLDRIVLNLLQNALKYSPPESEVGLEVHGGSGRVTIRVVDHGPGIPPADLPHIFERFYRGHRTEAGGLGLGLYSVRLLVEAHGGSVRAEPTPGGGTTFVVTLPADAPEPTPSGAHATGRS
jgi:signal transduction histidine kinase